MGQSTVPAAVADLIAKANATKADTTVVIDSYSTASLPDDYLGIAFSGDSGSPGIELTGDIVGAATGRTEETYNIICQVSTWSGDSDPVPARTKVLAMFDPFAVAVGADPRLSDSVMQARISEAHFIAGQKGQGSTATIDFIVSIRAFRTAT